MSDLNGRKARVSRFREEIEDSENEEVPARSRGRSQPANHSQASPISERSTSPRGNRVAKPTSFKAGKRGKSPARKLPDGDQDASASRLNRANKRRVENAEYHKSRKATWRKIWTLNGLINPSHFDTVRHWAVFRWLGRRSPWILIVLDLCFAAVVGTTGMGWAPEDVPMLEGLGWFAYREGYRLGAWGYCDDSWNCVRRPFYDLPWSQGGEVWYGTQILSGLLLSVGLAGLFLGLASIWILLLAISASHQSQLQCTGCTSCIENAIGSSISRSEDKADDEEEKDDVERRPKEAWNVVLEWVMWAFMVWIVVVFAGLEIWQRVGEAEGLMGDEIMTTLVCSALGWVVVWFEYRSDWAEGVSEELTWRKKEEG